MIELILFVMVVFDAFRSINAERSGVANNLTASDGSASVLLEIFKIV